MVRYRDGVSQAQWLSTHILPLEPELRRWLLKSKHASFDVDDIIQETYAKLVSAGDLSTVSQPRSYAYTVMRSVIADRFRRKKIVSFEAISELEALETSVEILTPEDHAKGRNELRFLLDRLAELPVKTRHVFMLSRIQGLSVKAVAAETGFPPSTVEKHIAKALKYLMDCAKNGGSPAVTASTEVRTPEQALAHRRRYWRYGDS